MKALTTLFVFLSLTSIFGSTMERYLLVDIGNNDEKIEENAGGNDLMEKGDIFYIKSVSVSTAKHICLNIRIFTLSMYARYHLYSLF